MKWFPGITALIVVVPLVASLAQENDQRKLSGAADTLDGRSGNEVESGRRAERLRAMQKIAEGITVETVDADGRTKAALVEGARFRFASSVTNCIDATAWLWGIDQRPLALVTISAHQFGKDGACKWSYELTSLAPSELYVRNHEDWEWKPEKAGLNFQPLPDAPAPAESHARRQRQIKDLSRRFDAYGMYGPAHNERLELRTLPTPIAHYADERLGVRDGAMFFVAAGTDPEALLAIELSGEGAAGPVWKYALNRVSAGELHVRLDGNEVWSCQWQAEKTARSPYTIIVRPMPRELGNE